MAESPPLNTPTSADAALFREFLTGDPEAQQQFVRRWEASMYRIAFRIVGQAADAEEVRQIVLLRMIQQPGRCLSRNGLEDGSADVSLTNRFRCCENEKKAADWNELDEPSCPPPSNDDVGRQLRRAIQKLEPDERALLALRFDEGLTVRQIGETVSMLDRLSM